MIYICKSKKIAIYVNSKKKSMAAIKKETGCTAIINGGLYTMSTFTPVCHLKVDGKVIVADKWKYYGLAWNDNVLDMVSDYSNYANYICCVAIIRNGKKVSLSYDTSAIGGSRQRTAFGVFDDGRVWMYAVKSPTKTPEQLQTIALNAGVKHAIMLDSGGSTQGASPSETVSSSRIVHNYICVWADDDNVDGTSTNTTNNSTGSGDTVTVNVSVLKSGSKGSSVKALQILLNGFGYSCGSVDGSFGPKTVSAVKTFQTKNGLTADGSVGSLTWAKILGA